MRIKDFVFSGPFLKVLFVSLIFLLLFLSSIIYKNTLQVSNSTKWVVHSYKVHLALDRLMLTMKDAETGQRGFILTHDKDYLKPYLGSKIKARSTLAQLKWLSSDNTEQEKNLEKLEEMVELRFGYLRYSMYQDSLGSMNKMNLKESLDAGRNLMDSIEVQSNKMIALEQHYLEKRNENYVNKTTVTPLLILLIVLFSLAIFSMAYFKINKDLSVMEETNRQLMITNESNRQAEKIGGFCTWTWDLKTGELKYSDNLYELLGCEPQSFKPTRKSFTAFIHPEDRQKITEEAAALLIENKQLIQHFRVIRKDGVVRHFKSIARTIDHKDKRTVIGIMNDITDQNEASFAMEQRNFELEQINGELESFNHVTSHDLQEPLRKIQTFISRISANDMDSMSETGREYIGKILSSATKMRTLIDDLLLFSRTNKADKVFEKADLNELLQNSLQELAQAIQEKKATVTADPLPELQVIPYQIQQLFTNLISNSLKYSRPDVNPAITIRSEKISISQMTPSEAKPDKIFYQISVSDNGMGFDPQFSESIFTLFQRLHSSSEFPGTGIGLAICKKIVENHKGTIKAEGRLNEGAVFTFFLPE